MNIREEQEKREHEYMVYIKKSEQISDFIKYLNASPM